MGEQMNCYFCFIRFEGEEKLHLLVFKDPGGGEVRFHMCKRCRDNLHNIVASYRGEHNESRD